MAHPAPLHVAILGATGRLGPAVLAALESEPAFRVTVLQRQSSTAAPPAASAAPVVRIPDDFAAPALVTALRGLDALVVTMPGGLGDLHIQLAEACVAAGVARFVPPDYGSVDSSDAVVARLVPLYRHKTRVRERLGALSAQHAAFSWTAIVCGHFFDDGLASGLLGFDLAKRTAQIFDDGEVRWSASTLGRIGEAVVRVLRAENREATRDKIVYVQSFCVSQLDVLEAVMAAGLGQVEASFVKSQDFIQGLKEKVEDGDPDATEEMVKVLGITRANWEGKEGFMNAKLGLPEQDMPSVVREVCRKFEAPKQSVGTEGTEHREVLWTRDGRQVDARTQ